MLRNIITLIKKNILTSLNYSRNIERLLKTNVRDDHYVALTIIQDGGNSAMEVTDQRALSVSRFIDQCGVCRVVAPVDFLVVCSCLGHTRIFFVWFSWVDAVIIQRARKRAHRQIQRKDATEDILDSDQYGRHSRGMQRRYRGEYDYFHSLLSVISSTIVRSSFPSCRVIA